jgi:hypothetical protein
MQFFAKIEKLVLLTFYIKENQMQIRRLIVISCAALSLISLNAWAEKGKTAAAAQPVQNQHKSHEHKHKHGSKDCAHKAEKHDDHIDYEDEGHHHKNHGKHYDECSGPENDSKSEKKPETKTE